MEKMDIIYEDKDLLVVNKPSKLLTISDGDSNNTLYSRARSYVKKQHKSNKIFIVHRLDRDTSGVVVFAKNEKMKKYLQDNWNKITKREYIGIVEGYIEQDRGIIREYLKENKIHKVYASKGKDGEYAETYFKVLKKKSKCTVLRLEIKTGKKNQIRVGLSNLGYPIIGDKKYGSKNNRLGRLGLHHEYLEVCIKGRKYEFKAKMPKEFKIFLN